MSAGHFSSYEEERKGRLRGSQVFVGWIPAEPPISRSIITTSKHSDWLHGERLTLTERAKLKQPINNIESQATWTTSTVLTRPRLQSTDRGWCREVWEQRATLQTRERNREGSQNLICLLHLIQTRSDSRLSPFQKMKYSQTSWTSHIYHMSHSVYLNWLDKSLQDEINHLLSSQITRIIKEWWAVFQILLSQPTVYIGSSLLREQLKWNLICDDLKRSIKIKISIICYVTKKYLNYISNFKYNYWKLLHFHIKYYILTDIWGLFSLTGLKP